MPPRCLFRRLIFARLIAARDTRYGGAMLLMPPLSLSLFSLAAAMLRRLLTRRFYARRFRAICYAQFAFRLRYAFRYCYADAECHAIFLSPPLLHYATPPLSADATRA